MIDLTNSTTRQKEAHLNEVGRIIRMPDGAKKWRAAHDYWLRQNPANAEQSRLAHLRARELQRTRANKFASSNQNKAGTVGGSKFRMGVGMPTGAMLAIEAFHPDLLKGEEGKGNFAKLCKEFVEYRIPEVI